MINFVEMNGYDPEETPKKLRPGEVPFLKIHKTQSPERKRPDEPVMAEDAEFVKEDLLFESCEVVRPEQSAWEDPGPIGVAKFNGYWMQRSDTEGAIKDLGDIPVAHIENGILRWRLLEAYGNAALQEGVILTLTHAGDLVLNTDLQGEPGAIYSGKLINGTIKWSDGEIWHPDPYGENIVKYNGTWLQDGEMIAKIWELSLHWQPSQVYKILGDVQTALIITERGTLEMLMGGEKFTGELIDGVLCWSDGMKWTKQPPQPKKPRVIIMR